MDRYSYDGPVMEFNKIIANRWTGETCAASESKARSNLAYQFKKQFNRTASSKTTLPGKITRVGQEAKIS